MSRSLLRSLNSEKGQVHSRCSGNVPEGVSAFLPLKHPLGLSSPPPSRPLLSSLCLTRALGKVSPGCSLPQASSSPSPQLCCLECNFLSLPMPSAAEQGSPRSIRDGAAVVVRRGLHCVWQRTSCVWKRRPLPWEGTRAEHPPLCPLLVRPCSFSRVGVCDQDGLETSKCHSDRKSSTPYLIRRTSFLICTNKHPISCPGPTRTLGIEQRRVLKRGHTLGGDRVFVIFNSPSVYPMVFHTVGMQSANMQYLSIYIFLCLVLYPGGMGVNKMETVPTKL